MLNNNRIGQIISFAQLASSPIESAKMTILGFARGHPFNSSDLISLIGRQLFPTMIVRPSLWSDIQIQLKVFFVEAAVSVEEGESWFQADYSNTGALAKDELKNKDGYGRLHGYRVRIIDFSKFLQELNSSSLLLKVDIEGEEARLLPAIIPYLPHKCAIFFESHGGEEVWQKLSQSLMNAQFQVRKLRRRLPYIDGFAHRC